jgi:hypothetical protein
MIGAPIAHLSGIPIEETLASSAPRCSRASEWHGQTFAPASAGCAHTSAHASRKTAHA